jgi:hypothetical protein
MLAGFSECRGSTAEAVVHNGKCWMISSNIRFEGNAIRGCKEWGGSLAPLRDKSDQAVIRRLGNRVLAGVIAGAYNPRVGLERRGSSASSFYVVGRLVALLRYRMHHSPTNVQCAYKHMPVHVHALLLMGRLDLVLQSACE